ncbi:pseudouridine synthase [Pelagibaculum spongiae]|uniref:Pseudouridine synthase n=1 Tax=Pelagibaculum spongiae TaxID=2080658 RepID=A0A2V1H2V0_9GAMM|nr:pseudouridine synthase [Pelagibaculum spongiae]PVZ71497.1 pseudouridine synthase [Pelagibaculum spongiae]
MLLLLNKPFNVLCQFTDSENRPTLADYVQQPQIYPAGRLDRDSEGLLLLTNDGKLQSRISHPANKLQKTYIVQVEGIPDDNAIETLRKGVKLKDGKTKPAKVKLCNTPDWLWPRTPPVRFRANIPTRWLEISITEGKNRQVRRMTAAIGHPTLRLIRTHIGPWSLSNVAPGETRLIQNPWSELPTTQGENLVTADTRNNCRNQRTQASPKKDNSASPRAKETRHNNRPRRHKT